MYFVQSLGNEKEEKSREKRLERKRRHFGKRREICNEKRDLYREKKKKLENKFVFCTILGNEKEEETREKKSYGKKIMGKGSRNN